jgi:XRE family transcriptional regulator, regulator of sulfur utilization
MAKASQLKNGRPFGSTSFEPKSAAAFGLVVRAKRLEEGISQENLAHMALLERAHIGRIERGENQPSLWIILKLAKVLQCAPGELLNQTLSLLDKQKDSPLVAVKRT